MRTCNTCKVEKEMTDFPWQSRSRATRAYRCKACYRDASNSRPREYVNSLSKKSLAIKYEFLNTYKESRPCTDCGIYYPHYVMDFDHLRDKRGDISAMVLQHGIPWLKEEILKCEVVCSNCHRVRTWKRGHSSPEEC